MAAPPAPRHVVVLAPMPLELHAIVTAFGLAREEEGSDRRWAGRIGGSAVTAIHIGMGPAITRTATAAVLDEAAANHRAVHVMIAGICGGLDPELPVGTLLNPEVVVDHRSGAAFVHRPPGQVRAAGKLITTEGVSLDTEQSRRFFADGCLGVDMESAAVAEVCEARGSAWSVYRCIGDRYVDGLLDERVLALSNPDGSGNAAELQHLLADHPELAANLRQLSHDSALAARVAAEAAVQGCLALDG